MEKPLETAWMGLEVEYGGTSGNHQVEQCKPDCKTHRCGACLLTLGGEDGSSKEQWPLPALLSGRKLPPALILMPDTSVPPHMFPVHYKLMPQLWSLE